MSHTLANITSAKSQTKRRFARDPDVAAQPPALPSGTETPPTVPAPQPAPAKPSKIANVIVMLQREEGATLAEMITATGWLSHTTRAALTGLRNRGHALEKSKRDNATCYRIVSQA